MQELTQSGSYNYIFTECINAITITTCSFHAWIKIVLLKMAFNNQPSVKNIEVFMNQAASIPDCRVLIDTSNYMKKQREWLNVLENYTNWYYAANIGISWKM